MTPPTVVPPAAAPMDFSDALRAMRHGAKVRRADWVGVTVALGGPDAFQGIFLAATTPRGDGLNWVPRQADLLASDWELVR